MFILKIQNFLIVIFYCIVFTYDSIIMLMAVSSLHHNAYILEEKHQKAKGYIYVVFAIIYHVKIFIQNKSTIFGTVWFFLDY